jgi:hypothetical protein
MPKKNTQKRKYNTRRYKKTNNFKKRSYKKNRYMKGGNEEIQNYALNTYNIDPNYMQISARNVVQHGSGKMKKTRKNGGSMFDFVSNQLSNPISNFPNYNSTDWLIGKSSPNSAPYVQPIGNSPYTGAIIK